jgi:putative SOS response-associated peptidase YedK
LGGLLGLVNPIKECPTSSLLRPYPAEAMTAFQVDTRVNNVKHNDDACVAPLDV